MISKKNYYNNDQILNVDGLKLDRLERLELEINLESDARLQD